MSGQSLVRASPRVPDLLGRCLQDWLSGPDRSRPEVVERQALGASLSASLSIWLGDRRVPPVRRHSAQANRDLGELPEVLAVGGPVVLVAERQAGVILTAALADRQDVMRFYSARLPHTAQRPPVGLSPPPEGG